MRKLLGFITLFGLIFLVACGSKIETNMSKKIVPFEFTTQDNKTLSNEDLEGKWWVADMIFTNCTTVCLPMTTNMSKLQDKLQEEKLDVELVSFSVDPEYDTPEVLTEYAKGYGADLENWTFLTGYDFQTIKELSIKSFMAPVVEAPEGDDQVTHGINFYLIDPEGKVIKNYKGTDTKELDNLVNDLKKVAK